MNPLEGRVALITGGSRGIGLGVANAAPFLTADASSWMTGQTLVLDGGATALPIAVAD